VAKSLYDCHVTAVCSGRNAEYVRNLGADEVIDYTIQPVLQTLVDSRASGGEYDLIVDCVGGTDLIPSYVSFFHHH
jgi:NADPH:quinone reductase-like Zn-dependent oxidoreductase